MEIVIREANLSDAEQLIAYVKRLSEEPESNIELSTGEFTQEIAPGVAMDRAEHLAMGLTVNTKAGTFNRCVETRETSPLDPGIMSMKKYCPGVGLVVDAPGDKHEKFRFRPTNRRILLLPKSYSKSPVIVYR